jgi:hypothetical protein
VAFATVAFWEHYWPVKAVAGGGDVLLWFSRGWATILFTAGYTSFTFPDSFGITVFNMVSELFYVVHFLGLLFGGLYPEALVAVHKQMWQIQVCLTTFFLVVAYLGFKDATEAGNADSEKKHTVAATNAKSLGSFTFHQENVNKFFGVVFLIYAIFLTFLPDQFFAHYFTAKATNFKLFLFLTRTMGTMFLAISISIWQHAGSDALSTLMLISNPIWLIHFLALVFGGLYDDAIWTGFTNTWYAQIFLNLVFSVVAYLGHVDAAERRAAVASGTATTTAASLNAASL